LSYRFNLYIDAPRRGWLRIRDTYLGASNDKSDHWTEWEKLFGIIQVVLNIGPDFSADTVSLATVSSHAVARWFERTGNVSCGSVRYSKPPLA
jgi:hypothetical protein